MSPATLSAALEQACHRWPDRTALVCDGDSLTYSATWKAISRLAGAYRRLGVIPGDRVVCQLPNGPEHVVAAGAAWLCGAVHVGADAALTPRETAWLTGHVEATVVVLADAGSDDRWACARAVLAEHSATTVVADTETSECDGVIALAELVDGPAAPTPPDDGAGLARPEDDALIFFTSGTTGVPKGVPHRHAKLVESWLRLAETLRLTEHDVHLGQLPLAHGFGLAAAIAALISGGELVVVERFSPAAALRLVEERGITVLHGVPAHYSLILDQLEKERRDVGSLRIGVASSAAFSPELLDATCDHLGMELVLAYGSSEGMSVGTADREVIRRGSVGRPAPGSVRVVDGRTRASAPHGEVGEIEFLLSEPVRYWGQETPAASPGEWFSSGDLGRLDPEGYLYVLGRASAQINRAGQKVDPSEVEEYLARWPEATDAAVIGLSDPVLGEVVCACVVPRPGATPSIGALREFLGPFLTSYKIPDELCLVEEVPRTQLGKVLRAALRERATKDERRQTRLTGRL